MSEKRVHLSKTQPAAYQALDALSKTVGDALREAGIPDRLKELVMIHCSQLNGCAYCTRIHVDRALAAGIDTDTLMQITTWRESHVFDERSAPRSSSRRRSRSSVKTASLTMCTTGSAASSRSRSTRR